MATAACGKMAITGSAPACLFWAECEHQRLSIDCTAGTGKCQCAADPATPGAVVPYEPAFCALDPANARASLRAILDRARVVCRWR
jgi:hypothetical protein